MSSRNPKRRVKVYELNADGQWTDRGTGFVQVTFTEPTQETFFVVKSEVNEDELLLQSRVYTEDVYQLQQDTLIVWQEPDTNRDVALSFQESQGCAEIWELLSMLRGGEGGMSQASEMMSLEMPAVTPENLPAIFGTIQRYLSNPSEVEQLCLWILRSAFHTQLFSLFEECETRNDHESLKMLFLIWRSLLFANNVTLLELILSEDCILHFFGALEYDPRVPPARRFRHREFLRSTEMREVVPLANEELRTRIRQTYYIQYLRDVIMAGVIEDQLCATINSFVVYNQMDIVALVRRDPDVLQQIMSLMKDPDDSDVSFLDKLRFIHELCTLAKVCNVAGRMELYGLLSHLGIFQILELALRRTDSRIRTFACEVINLSLSHNVTLLRQYVLAQVPAASFLLVLVDGIIKEPDLGLKSQFTGILQALLDPEGMDKNNVKEQMLGIWYEHCMLRLIEPLNAPVDEQVVAKEYVMEMLEFCIRFHEYRIKYFVLGNGVTRRVSLLLEHRDRFLQLAGVRLIRTILQIRDTFFERHLIRHRMFDCVMELLVRNAGANNLIDSAILEMLQFVQATPLIDIAKDIVSRWRDVLLGVKYVATCAKLVQSVDEWSMGRDGGTSVSRVSPDSQRKRMRGMGEDDDSWFEQDDEEHAGRPGRLVHNDSMEGLLEFDLPSVVRASDRDDLDDLPVLGRHDTPPLTFEFLSNSASGGASGPIISTHHASGGEGNAVAFHSLRLPLEPGALVAGLAAEATRLVAEATTGGPFWDSNLDSVASPGSGARGSPALSPQARSPKSSSSPTGLEEKRRKVDEGPPPSSLLDEFLRDAAMEDNGEPHPAHLDE